MNGKLSTAASIITCILVPTVGFFAGRNITQGERLGVVEKGQATTAEQVALMRSEMKQAWKDLRVELRDDIKALGVRMDRRQ